MAFPLHPERIKAPGPLCQISLSDLKTAFGMLNGLQIEIVDGDNKTEVRAPAQDGSNWTIRIPNGMKSFSGNVWVGGKKVSVPTTGQTQYLKITFGSSPSASWVTAMPETMDSDSEVFDIDQTPGDLHLSANMG